MTDPRYKTGRWRKLRAYIIRRDGRHCAIPGCTTDMTQAYTTIVDHITEVTEHTTDAEFYNPDGLQVLCWSHNIAKGHDAAATRDEPTSPNG